MEDWSIHELNFRIAACKCILLWLNSDDPMLTEPEYVGMVPVAKETYKAQYDELLEARNKKKAVQVGLGTAKIIPKVLGG